jgi:hypothetical protein
MLVGAFAELSASEMSVVARVRALQWQLAPRPFDARGVSNGARAVLVFVARKREQCLSKRQSACFHKKKYNFVYFSAAQATFLLCHLSEPQ